MAVTRTVKLLVPDQVGRVLREGLTRAQRIALKGDAVECPVCGSTFRRFAAFGEPPRPGARCPQCRSLERHRLLWLFLERHTAIGTERMRVLHVGPEQGLVRRFRALPNLEYLTADLDPTRADVQMDITKIAFPDGHFDVVLCSNVLEHVTDAGVAMRELYRVLSPDGFALIDVPINPDLDDTYEDWSVTTPYQRAKAFGQKDHVRWFGRNFPDLLRGAGFTVDVGPSPPTAEEAHRFGLREADSIVYCTKPKSTR